jgi:hypothetical protein
LIPTLRIVGSVGGTAVTSISMYILNIFHLLVY